MSSGNRDTSPSINRITSSTPVSKMSIMSPSPVHPTVTKPIPTNPLPFPPPPPVSQNSDLPPGGPPHPPGPPQPPVLQSPPHQVPPLQHLQQLYTLALADRMRFFNPATNLLSPYSSSPFSPLGPPRFPGMPGSPDFHPLYPYGKFDPRLFRIPEEPKPQHSYIGLIAMAILSVPDNKLVLADIYQYILDNFSYFRHRGPGWRNSIRHNLSLNDCFIKAGRAANGKGHFWAIHPACIDDFKKGDYRRRKAQRKVRRHMGLAVEEEDSPSPPPPPVSPPTGIPPGWPVFHHTPGLTQSLVSSRDSLPPKRQFDVASILGIRDHENRFGSRPFGVSPSHVSGPLSLPLSLRLPRKIDTPESSPKEVDINESKEEQRVDDDDDEDNTELDVVNNNNNNNRNEENNTSSDDVELEGLDSTTPLDSNKTNNDEQMNLSSSRNNSEQDINSSGDDNVEPPPASPPRNENSISSPLFPWAAAASFHQPPGPHLAAAAAAAAVGGQSSPPGGPQMTPQEYLARYYQFMHQAAMKESLAATPPPISN